MLTQTPPLGWKKGNTSGANVSEELARETAQAFIDSGLKQSGRQSWRPCSVEDFWIGEDQDISEREFRPRVDTFGAEVPGIRSVKIG
jgi:alpha-galactosidase